MNRPAKHFDLKQNGDNFYEIMDKVEDWLNEEYTGVNMCFYEDLDGQINDSII